jgi:hypothetical protein
VELSEPDVRRLGTLNVMRAPFLIASGTLAVALLAVVARSSLQTTRPALDLAALRDYSGVYEWSPGAYVYLQPWNELTERDELVAFDESGDVRVLYPGERDRFSAGPGAAVQTPVESRIEFRRDSSDRITALPRANHLHLEAKTGSNPEMAGLQGFVPEYFSTVRAWLASRVEGFDNSR